MSEQEKPDYNPETILNHYIKAAAELYQENCSLREIAAELSLNPQKVRKLLITGGVYFSPIAEEIAECIRKGMAIEKIMEQTKLSRSSVNSYLPYTRPPYKANEISTNAMRIAKYRERKMAMTELEKNPSKQKLWDTMLLFEGYPFKTCKGLLFRYTIKGGEMFVNRKRKSITRSTIEIAYDNALALNREVSGPKKLEVFGASYLYAVFLGIGVVKSGQSVCSADER